LWALKENVLELQASAGLNTYPGRDQTWIAGADVSGRGATQSALDEPGDRRFLHTAEIQLMKHITFLAGVPNSRPETFHASHIVKHVNHEQTAEQAEARHQGRPGRIAPYSHGNRLSSVTMACAVVSNSLCAWCGDRPRSFKLPGG
jgi:hypothetical protein